MLDPSTGPKMSEIGYLLARSHGHPAIVFWTAEDWRETMSCTVVDVPGTETVSVSIKTHGRGFLLPESQLN